MDDAKTFNVFVQFLAKSVALLLPGQCGYAVRYAFCVFFILHLHFVFSISFFLSCISNQQGLS